MNKKIEKSTAENNSQIQLITDSTTSLSQKELEDLGIDYVETNYIIDGELHEAFDDEKTSLKEFYSVLDRAKSCSTGCVNVFAFEQIFDKYASAGKKVFYTGLSASLSSTFSNAKTAAENINKKYNKKMVAVVDSRSASYGTLVLLDYAREMIASGVELEELEQKIDAIAKNMSVAFVARDLTFMHKCGRISFVEAGLGKLLHIVPIIYVSESGKLKIGDKCLGTKLAQKTLKNKFTKLINEKKYKKCYITSCDLPQEVEDLKNHIESNTEIKDIKTGLIDKTLACCCGPKTIAVFCG